MNVKSASILSRTHQAYSPTAPTHISTDLFVLLLFCHFTLLPHECYMPSNPQSKLMPSLYFLCYSRTSSSDWHVFCSCLFSEILSMSCARSSMQYEINSRSSRDMLTTAELANKAKSLFRWKSDTRIQWSASLDWLTVYELQHSDEVYAECVLPDMGRSSTRHALTSSHNMHFVELSRALHTESTQYAYSEYPNVFGKSSFDIPEDFNTDNPIIEFLMPFTRQILHWLSPDQQHMNKYFHLPCVIRY